MATITICSDFEAPPKIVWHCIPIYFPWSDGTRCHDLHFLNIELYVNLFKHTYIHKSFLTQSTYEYHRQLIGCTWCIDGRDVYVLATWITSNLILVVSVVTHKLNFYSIRLKAMKNLGSILKRRDITLPTKVHLVKTIFIHCSVFSSVTQSHLTLCNPMDYSTTGVPVLHQLPEPTQTHVHSISQAIQPSHPLSSLSPPVVIYGCESWTIKKAETPKNWGFWTVAPEETLGSPLNKKIKPVNAKGNQPWIVIGRTDAEAEAPILWPPDGNSWLIEKDPDAVRQ